MPSPIDKALHRLGDAVVTVRMPSADLVRARGDGRRRRSQVRAGAAGIVLVVAAGLFLTVGPGLGLFTATGPSGCPPARAVDRTPGVTGPVHMRNPERPPADGPTSGPPAEDPCWPGDVCQSVSAPPPTDGPRPTAPGFADHAAIVGPALVYVTFDPSATAADIAAVEVRLKAYGNVVIDPDVTEMWREGFVDGHCVRLNRTSYTQFAVHFNGPTDLVEATGTVFAMPGVSYVFVYA